MMADLLQTGGAGGAGALIGALATFFGFKSRLDSFEKKIELMSCKVVYTDAFNATITGIKEQMSTQTSLITEMRKDIKELLGAEK